ncbi:ketopantoate reductase family protein [Micromonospora sp. 4G55]|uniref:ketopantoate reductase family protein n=1 Tax=Micromonospora sp. 4G55 TaxID=2806102 RepID=UPI001EE49840|nr:2-dehydropantoate 2-reductase N-terminal domain-containing protein [Micromonospora sp. 4G55]
MRYVIIGAGAVGGTIGVRLGEAGHDVTLVARGAHLDAIRRDGLTLRTPEGTATWRGPPPTLPGSGRCPPTPSWCSPSSRRTPRPRWPSGRTRRSPVAVRRGSGCRCSPPRTGWPTSRRRCGSSPGCTRSASGCPPPTWSRAWSSPTGTRTRACCTSGATRPARTRWTTRWPPTSPAPASSPRCATT